MADYLNRNHQRGQPPDRPREMRQVLKESLLPEAHEVVVNENQQGAPAWHGGSHGGRLEARNNANQIAEKYKKEQRADKGKEFRPLMPDVFCRFAAKKQVDNLENV